MVSYYQFSTTLKSKYLYIFYASMAFGTLTKGLIAIVLTIAIIFCYCLLTKNLKTTIEKYFSYRYINFSRDLCAMVLFSLQR